MKKTQQWKTRLAAMLLAGGLGFTGAAQAALHDRGGGLIYDDVLEITWLWDANHAQTRIYDADGMMTWDKAVAWADGLSYYDSVRVTSWDDWRLPTSLNRDGSDPCPGYSCIGSEMGHMFYNNMEGSAESSILAASDPNDYLSLFENLQSYVYWSGTEYAPNTGNAWGFSTGGGIQDNSNKYDHHYAWAVRDGDVNPVPIPAAVWLFGSALVGLVGIGRRKLAA